MPTQTGSIDFTSTGGFKSYATNKYATQSTVSQMQTDISQNAENITLRATKTEASLMAQPNLTPYFSADPTDVYNSTTNPHGYWHVAMNAATGNWTQLEDGWARLSKDNSSGSSTTYGNVRTEQISTLKPDTDYTLMVEARNVTVSGTVYLKGIALRSGTGQFAATQTDTLTTTSSAVFYQHGKTVADLTGCKESTSGYIQITPGASITGDFRFSLYESAVIDAGGSQTIVPYDGPYKPYIGPLLYASQAELKVQSDRIGMVVANNDASSSLQLTSDAMTYIGDHVEIKGTDGTSTAISGGRIQANSLTIGAFDSSTQNDILNDNVQVGGRNLLRHTGSPVASDLALTRATVADGVITVTPTTSNAYAKFKVDYLDFDDYGEGEYTVSFDAKAVSGATYTQLKGPMFYAAFNPPSRLNNNLSSSYDRYAAFTLSETLTYEWVRYSKTFTVPNSMTTGQASALASGSNLTIQLAMSGSYAPMQVRNVKLEKGNKATDWTPAPEDITAEKYITSINDNGIRVHAKSNTTTNYAAIDADGMDVVKGGVSVAQFGEDNGNGPSARIGKEASTHVTISASETSGTGYTDSTSDMTLYDATGNSPDLRLYNTSRAWSDDSDGSEEVGIALGRDVYASKIRASIYEGEDPSSNLEILTGDLSTSVNAGTFIGSQRHWASDSSKYDKASVSTASGAGGGASVQISAMSGNPNAAGAYAGMSVKATSSGTTVTIEADEVKLYDHQQDSYSPAYMTHGVVNSGQSTATPANGYQDFSVAFGHTYSAAPHVVVGFYSTSTASALGGLSCAVNSITYTGCTIRVFNNTSSARSPAVEWIAIG